MLQSSYVDNRSVLFRAVSSDAVWEIQQTAFAILENTGCDVLHAGARSLLKQAGARVRGDRVQVPRHIVQACLQSAPKGINVFSRDGAPALELAGRKSYYGTSTASPRTRDPLTGEIRDTLVSDIATSARIADTLPNIDWVMPMGSVQDVPALAADVYEFEAVVTNTTKPIVFIGYSPEGQRAIYEMAAEVAGGLEQLQARPFLIAYPEPISPLVYPAEVVDRIFIAADLAMPQIPGPAVQPGGTGPVTLAGAVAQLVAESLLGVVLVQLRRPGAPTFLGGNIGILDMSTTSMCVGAPEMSLALAVYAEVAQSFGLPTWGLAGATDAKVLDAQAGIESTFSILAQGLAGLNLIHDVGYMDCGMICSAEMLVMGDEVIAMTKRFVQGVEVTPETLAREVVARVGPGGNYLADDHTAKWHRQQLWRPRLATRQNYTTWEQTGSKNMEQRVRERVMQILKTSKPKALPDHVMTALAGIRAKREKEAVAE